MSILAYICTIGGMLICFAGLILMLRRDDRRLDEAERRDAGMLLQDEQAARHLHERLQECKERMGRELTTHPEYEFNERHRVVTGRK